MIHDYSEQNSSLPNENVLKFPNNQSISKDSFLIEKKHPNLIF